MSWETGTQAWQDQFKTALFYVVHVTGNPLGILATMKLYVAIIRQTALEMCGVPENLKEAAVAFIVFKWQLLKDIETPQALPSIMTGINQAILISLLLVVIVSLICVEGLGLLILERIQDAAKRQGLLEELEN